MDKAIFQETKDLVKRRQIIEDNCDEILEDYEYKRQFSEDEIEEMRTDLSDILVGIDVLEEKFETIKVDHKGKVKPLKDKVRKTLMALREGAERIKGNCYVIRDLSIGEMGIYDGEGNLVTSRKLKPSEKQKTIHMALREGTNN